MIKRLVLSCAALGALTACNSPAQAAPSDLCDLLPAAELSREFNERITVTKRLDSGSASPWAYCLYGTPTQHLLTLAAPVTSISGNVKVLPGPGVDVDHAAQFEETANERMSDGYAIDPIDTPPACAELQESAEAIIGRVTHARGSADENALTCDFIGENGTISAQSRPQAFAQNEDLTGVTILEEPDVTVKAVKNAKELTITGFVDHQKLVITVTQDDGYRTASIDEVERAFAREFADASW